MPYHVWNLVSQWASKGVISVCVLLLQCRPCISVWWWQSCVFFCHSVFQCNDERVVYLTATISYAYFSMTVAELCVLLSVTCMFKCDDERAQCILCISVWQRESHVFYCHSNICVFQHDNERAMYFTVTVTFVCFSVTMREPCILLSQ